MNRAILVREKVLRLVGLMTEKAITVTQRGSKAFCEYDLKGRPKLVNVPFIPDDADDEYLNAIEGYLDHEVGHVLYSNFDVLAEAKKLGVERLHNIIEDSFIERKMASIFAGSGLNLSNVGEFFLKTYTDKKLREHPEETVGYLMMPAIRALSGQAVYRDYMSDKWHHLDATMSKINGVAADLLPKIESSRDGLVLALEIKKLLSLAPEPPRESEEGEEGEGDGAPESKGSPKPKEPEVEEPKEPKESKSETKSEPEAEEPTPEPEESESDPDGESETSGPEEAGEPESEPESKPEPKSGESEESEPESEDEDSTGEDSTGESETGGSTSEGDPSEDGDEGESSEDSSTSGDDEVSEHEGDDVSEDSREWSEGTPKSKSPDWEDFEKALDDDFAKKLAEELSKVSERETKTSDYKVWTTELDVIEPMVVGRDGRWDESMLKEMQDSVDHMVGPLQKDLERAVAARSKSVFSAGHRSGRLHAGALSRLTMFNDDRVFRRKHESTTKDVAVELVIDCSGSMSGGKIDVASKTAYALASVLDRMNISNEVLGFTTTKTMPREMKAEEARIGVRYSRTQSLYIPIFKSFSERLNTESKKRFAALPGVEWLCENVDGESIAIAANRLAQRREKRKIMIVLSDGQPVCPGDSDAQRDHLGRTVRAIERSGIDVLGIGVMSSAPAKYYKKHVLITTIAELPTVVIGQIKSLLMQ